MVNELGAFLRARRTDAALEPERPSLGSRRVSGLRREEVASAAGISADYYVRLEQGRETNPSDSVLDALARALRLDPDAVQHLRRLRDRSSAADPGPPTSEAVARMEALVAAVRPNPAYVLDRLSTIVAANPEGLALFDGGLGHGELRQARKCRILTPAAPYSASLCQIVVVGPAWLSV